MKIQKTFDLIRRNPRNVRFEDFCKVMEAVGFTLVRQKGSHRAYKHTEHMEMMIVQPRHDGHGKPYQVRQFLALAELHRLKIMEP